MSQLFPEQTIRYKTYAKQTLVDGLNQVLSNHPDLLLQRTKASIEFPKTETDFPAVVVRFFEREVFNAGVGHTETNRVQGESGGIELEAELKRTGSVQLTWPAITGAAGYKVYKRTPGGPMNQSFTVVQPAFVDNGQTGTPESAPTFVTATLQDPLPTIVVDDEGLLAPGSYFYQVTAFEPAQAVKFQHYFYTADIEFAIYALSAYDRDLVADTLVQTIAMGKLESYTNNFFERIYPSNDLYPDAQLHFININSDRIQGFGENQAQTPWGAEDDLLYLTSYRVGVFGELYSLPPKLTYALVHKIFIFPYIQGIDPVPAGPPGDTAEWVSNVP